MRVLSIIRYKHYNDAFGNYLAKQNVEEQAFFVFNKVSNEKFPSKRKVMEDEILAFVKLLCHFWHLRNRVIFCTSAQYAVMSIFRMFGAFLGKDSRLFIYNFYLHGLSNNILVRRILRWMINNNRLIMICQSPNEVNFYRGLASTEQVKICFVPYSSNYMPKIEPLKISNLNNYIFTGGYSNRDYQLVGKLAERHPERQFVIVASKLNTNVNNLSPNIKLFKDLPKEVFENLLSHADAIICPLKEDVGSSGQMLCISAMRNKKPIIYTDVSAINYYFNEGTGYPYKIGSIDSLDNAYLNLFGNLEEARQRGEKVYLNSLNYTNENSYKAIYDIIREFS